MPWNQAVIARVLVSMDELMQSSDLHQRQFTEAVNNLLPFLTSLVASVSLGFVAKTLLDAPLRRQSERRQEPGDLGADTDWRLSNLKLFSPQPPTLDHHQLIQHQEYVNMNLRGLQEQYYQRLMKMQESQRRKQQKQSNFDDLSEFKPFFPAYHQKDLSSNMKKQISSLELKDWEKFLDTKTVVAGVDIVDVDSETQE